MNILVTGGNGYVGRALCRMLYKDHKVCVVDNLRYGSNRFTSEEILKLRLEQVDIRNKDAIIPIIGDFSPNVIIHLAAIHFIPECENDVSLAVSTNVTGTVNLLEACASDCRFVFASSGAVYQPEDKPHIEDTSPLKAVDIYSFTKLQGEEYVEYIAAKNNIPAVIVRLFNVIGPGETNPHVLPEIVAQLKSGHQVLNLGNLKPKRDYISVSDAARGFVVAALNGEARPGDVATVNLGTQTAYSVEHLLDILRKVSQIDFTVQTDPTRLRKVDRPYLAADRTKIKQLFSWNPKDGLESVITEMWANPDLPDYLIQKYIQ